MLLDQARDLAELMGFIPLSSFAAFTTATAFSGTMKAAEWRLDRVVEPAKVA
ncbi:MAG: hypothetical protein FJ090_09605 [Deltaproteobacteria bacterium]|nr:hypothetical protein [Deltaproteobacteria bacterium]